MQNWGMPKFLLTLAALIGLGILASIVIRRQLEAQQQWDQILSEVPVPE